MGLVRPDGRRPGARHADPLTGWQPGSGPRGGASPRPRTLTISQDHLPGYPYKSGDEVLYALPMDVPVSELRSHLSHWLAKVRAGDEVIVTERGVPVARLVPLDSTSVLERLTAEGVLSRPRTPKRPFSRPRPTNTSGRLLSDVVTEQRSDDR